MPTPGNKNADAANASGNANAVVVGSMAVWRRVLLAVGALMVAAAAVIASYPFWADLRSSYLANQNYSSATSYFHSLGSDEIDRAYAEARAYNNELSSGVATRDDTAIAALDQQKTGVISWLDIPKIGQMIPVYKGTDEDLLMLGAGHVERTSLPIGGDSTHAVVTAHSGMPGARMLDQLDRLDVGDVFVFWTLGQPIAYRVTGFETVEPDNVSVLRITPGRDTATILTCWPVGVNTHRLLVHGDRTDYDAGMQDTSIVNRVDSRTGLFIASLIALGALGWLGLLYVIRPRKVWKLSSVSGTASDSGAEDGAQLAFKSFGRVELNASGGKTTGHWRRVAGDPSKVYVTFNSDATGVPAMHFDLRADVVLPKGEVLLHADGDVLSIAADYGNTNLVFRE